MVGFLWYQTVLARQEREIYDALMRGLLAGEKEIRVPKCDPSRLSVILELVRMDQPMLFDIDGFRYRTVRGEPTFTVLPNHSFPPKQRAELTASLEKRLCRILAPILPLSPEEAIDAIHNFVLSSVTYERVRKNDSHEIVGVLHHGIGVCEGISKTVKLFCDRLDIPCIIALGQGSPQGEGERHAWNLIRTGGVWRHYDMTYDLSSSRRGYESKRFFAMSDAVCFRSHGMPEQTLPSCPEEIETDRT